MSAAAGLKVSPQSTPSRDSPFDRGSPASGTDLNSAVGLLGSGVGVIGSGISGGGAASSVSPSMSSTSQSLSSYNPIWSPARWVSYSGIEYHFHLTICCNEQISSLIYTYLYFSFSSIGPVADLMSASSSYLDKNHCYNSHVYSQNYGSHCYYTGNMDYLSSGVPHPSLNVPVS